MFNEPPLTFSFHLQLFVCCRILKQARHFLNLTELSQYVRQKMFWFSEVISFQEAHATFRKSELDVEAQIVALLLFMAKFMLNEPLLTPSFHSQLFVWCRVLEQPRHFLSLTERIQYARPSMFWFSEAILLHAT